MECFDGDEVKISLSKTNKQKNKKFKSSHPQIHLEKFEIIVSQMKLPQIHLENPKIINMEPIYFMHMLQMVPASLHASVMSMALEVRHNELAKEPKCGPR